MRKTTVLCIVGLFFIPTGASLAAHPHTDVIRVRTDCGGVAPPQCFDDVNNSIGNALAAAIEEVHVPGAGRALPGATNHVVVDVGPGTFDLDLTAFSSTTYGYCDGPSPSSLITNLTYRGAGETATILRGGGYDNGFINGSRFAMLLRNCDDFTVEDLTLEAKDGGTTVLGQPVGVQSGVLFLGDGETYWRRMRIEASALAWYDAQSSPTTPFLSTHFWWDSTLKVFFDNACTSVFAAVLYGVHVSHTFNRSVLELTEVDGLLGPPGCRNGLAFSVIYLSQGFAVETHNSTYTFHTFDPTPLATAWFLGQGTGCSEGDSIVEGASNAVKVRSPLGNGETATIAVAFRTCGGELHLEGTTYDLAATDSTHRILNIMGTLDVHPQHIGSGTTPPTIGATVEGAETFTETDCGSVCSDASPGTEYHELAYDPACGGAGGPWFDRAAGVCR